MDEGLIQTYKEVLRNIDRFCEEASGIRLRSYQVQVAEKSWILPSRKKDYRLWLSSRANPAKMSCRRRSRLIS